MKGIMKFIFSYFVLLCILAFFAALAGCKSKTVFVPVETVKTEYNERHTRDSVYLHDSIMVKMKGDTVWMEKYKYLYRDKLIRDSVYITDSIAVPYPVKGDTQYINRLYWWQYLLMVLGAVCLGVIGYRIYGMIKG